MKKSILLLSVLAMGASVYAQEQGRVGINTASPKATLDISKEGVDDAKGLLIPRLTADEVKKMTDANKVGLDQNSLLLYVTQPFAETKNKTGKYELIDQAGYYYYDAKDNGGKWKRMTDSKSLWENIPSQNVIKLKKLSNGVTERTDDKNIFITDEGNIGIGVRNAEAPVYIKRIHEGDTPIIGLKNDIYAEYYDRGKGHLKDPFSIVSSRYGGTPNNKENLREGADMFSIRNDAYVNGKLRRLVDISSTYIGGESLSSLSFSVSGAENPTLYLKENQNVGIGTFTPSERLEVNGNIKITKMPNVAQKEKEFTNAGVAKPDGTLGVVQRAEAINIPSGVDIVYGEREKVYPFDYGKTFYELQKIKLNEIPFRYAGQKITLPKGKWIVYGSYTVSTKNRALSEGGGVCIRAIISYNKEDSSEQDDYANVGDAPVHITACYAHPLKYAFGNGVFIVNNTKESQTYYLKMQPELYGFKPDSREIFEFTGYHWGEEYLFAVKIK
ncbi:hypothetical protein ACT4R9_01605 [Ornithobacterium rhinotracheale]|uniref:hypothetical protein n=1 Tax=Ornithobacterium rhinotracheale TaxID=28251 RepID=UPI003FA41CB1